VVIISQKILHKFFFPSKAPKKIAPLHSS